MSNHKTKLHLIAHMAYPDQLGQTAVLKATNVTRQTHVMLKISMVTVSMAKLYIDTCMPTSNFFGTYKISLTEFIGTYKA